MKKKILLLIILLLLVCSCSLKKEKPEPILSYNGIEIYEDDIYDMYGKEGFNILIKNIDRELIKKETSKYKDEINKEVDSLISEYETYYGDEFEATISTYYGYGLDEFKKELYTSNALEKYILKEYKDKKDLTDEYIEKNTNRVFIEAKQYIREKNKVKFNNKNLQELYKKYQKEELESITEEIKVEETELSKYLKDITVEEIQNKLYNSETFILVVSRSDCSHCIKYLPVLSEVLDDYKLTVYRLELDSQKEEDLKYFEEIFEGVNGTPTTLFIKNGVEESSKRLVGSQDYSEIEKAFKDNGYIK